MADNHEKPLPKITMPALDDVKLASALQFIAKESHPHLGLAPMADRFDSLVAELPQLRENAQRWKDLARSIATLDRALDNKIDTTSWEIGYREGLKAAAMVAFAQLHQFEEGRALLMELPSRETSQPDAEATNDA